MEAALLPCFGQVLERNVVDFLPYTFQILGLLLDATPSVKPLYQDLFARLLSPELWRAQANVPGLIRLFRAYFTKHAVFAELLRTHLQGILERFQFVLCNRKTEGSAFDLMNAMYMHLPFEFYQPHLKTLLTVLLTRLQNGKSPRFQREFAISCSLLVHRQAPGLLPSMLREIQPGLLTGLISSVWLPALKMNLKLDERKVCTIALAKIMSSDEISSNAQAYSACCSSIVNLLGLCPSSTAAVGEDASDDEAAPNGGAGLDFEVTFNKLKNTDLPGAAAGIAPDIPDLHSAAKVLLQPQLAAIAQLAQASPELQPLARFLQ